jgi:hypothetical protein
MVTKQSVFERIADVLAGTGLIVRGAFHPVPDDGVRALADGRAAKTAVLVGNAGKAMWESFRRDVPEIAGKDPLDSWVDAHLERAAAALGTEIVFATRKPWPPIQRWALRAGGVHRSPIGILIHPEYGLWHVYRGALLFAEKLDLASAPVSTQSPCDTCAKKPCLTACPADAFEPDGFDMHACVGHVESAKGRACASGGCLARRACPVGRAHAYVAEEGAFHMAAVVRTVRRWAATGAKGDHAAG